MARNTSEQSQSLMGHHTIPRRPVPSQAGSTVKSQPRASLNSVDQPAAARASAKPLPAAKPGPRSLMQGAKREIVGGMLLLSLPVPLMATLLALIFSRIETHSSQSDMDDAIILNGANNALSSGFYYVNYSATRLAFVSSLSSTLALALVPVAMSLLYAYVAAAALQRASLLQQHERLPSPFQFKILLQMLAGGTLDIFAYFKYVTRRKQHRDGPTPLLNATAVVLSFMLLLALGVTITDSFVG